MTVVSIIMPCHNGERFLSEAICSVINQTYKDWELLIIDDNSTDCSITVIKDFISKDNRIKLLHTVTTSGYPATPRNIGINEAHGRYIAFLDCDDVWMPSKLQNQLNQLIADDVAVIYSNYYKMYSNNGRLIGIEAPSRGSFKTLLKTNFIGNLTGIYDVQKVGKVFQKEIHHEDYVMWLTILKTGFIAINTNTYEAYYRCNSGSISGNKIKTLFWQWDIYRKEIKLSLVSCVYHFIGYSINGMKKYFK